MALVNTGSLQLGLPASIPANQNISSEFGGAPAPYDISEYYRGGGLVPNNATNVPTSGSISFSNFYGTSATPPYTPVSVSIPNYSQERIDVAPPYSLSFSQTLTASASAGNGSYNYNWTRNAYTNPSGLINMSGSGSTGNPLTINGSNNSQGTFMNTHNGNWTVSVSDGNTNASANFSVTWTAEQSL
jgi:hypothetical protein